MSFLDWWNGPICDERHEWIGLYAAMIFVDYLLGRIIHKKEESCSR